MQAVIFEGPNILHLAEVPEPMPAAGEVRLATLLAGICSTDVHILHGRYPIRPPRILGHELVGVVDAVGPQVSESWIGKVCGVMPARFCGKCLACQRGRPELCTNFQCLGNTHDGGYAEKTIVREEQIVLLPEVKPDALVWLEPVACVLHGLQTVQAAKSETVLIIGAGTMGRLMSQVLRAISDTRIAVVDPNQTKVNQALLVGAEQGWTVPRTGDTPHVDHDIRTWASDGLQVVIDTTGDPVAIERALRWVGPAGKILLFGVSDPVASFPMYPDLVFSKELTLYAAAGMTPDSFNMSIALLQSHKIDTSNLISNVVSLKEVPDVLQDHSSLKKGKVVIKLNGNKW